MKITDIQSTDAVSALGEAARELRDWFPGEGDIVLSKFAAFIGVLAQTPEAWPSGARDGELKQALQERDEARTSRDALAHRLTNMANTDVVEVKQRRAADVLEEVVAWWEKNRWELEGHGRGFPYLSAIMNKAKRVLK